MGVRHASSGTDRALRLLAEEQAALRRVATLVASAPEPEDVFHAVAEEAGRLLGARTAVTVRFEDEGGVVVGLWDEGEGASFDVGTLVPYSDPDVPVYVASQHGGRIDDYTDVPGEAARMTRAAGYLSSVVASIVAGGRTWGALFVFSPRPSPLRPRRGAASGRLHRAGGARARERRGVVAECLTNAAKHAEASVARVDMSTIDDTAVVEIRDDGRGGAVLAGGSGLRGLADRVEALGGRLDVSSPPGAGTVVRAELPLR